MGSDVRTRAAGRWGRALCAAGLSFAIVAGPSHGWAQATQAEKVAARSLMEKADEAFEARRYPEALDMYLRADAVMGVPTTGLAVARALEKLDRLIEARRAAARVVELAIAGNEGKAFTDARVQAGQLAIRLQEETPTLQIVATGQGDQVRVAAMLDGALLAGDPAAPRALDPGHHEILVTAEGCKQSRQTVTVVRGQRARLEVKLEPIFAQARGSTSEDGRAGTGIPTLAWMGFSVGAIGIVAGAVTGALAFSKTSSARSQCDGNDCSNAAKSDADAAKLFATASNVSFAVGVVGAAVGVVSLLAASPSRSAHKAASPRWRLDVTSSLGGGGVTLVGRF
jgi:hypothetical protein